MKRLYVAGDHAEAYLLLGHLRAAGIEARVLNEHALGGVGEIPFTHAYPELWVLQEADLGRAREILQAQRGPQPAGPERVCPACAEPNPPAFETCWNCGANLLP